jgi:threonine dehydrogenase-like Zn-dependent dehydrogenase
MKACVFNGSLNLVEVPVPDLQEGEVLVKVLVSSICNTDIEIIKGYMGFSGILGHEFAGEVVSRSSSLFGKKVVGEINCSCDQCFLCKTARRTHCPNRSVIGIQDHDGAFADFIALPERNLHEIPETLSLEAAVFTEPLAAALEIFEQIRIEPSQKVFIFGAGKLGLLIGLIFRLNGCDYTIFTRSESSFNNARSMGLNTRPVSSISGSEKADVCVDCTGNPDGINLALSHLYPAGKLVLKTTVATTEKIDLNQLVINEFTLVGSRCGPFEPALKLLTEGSINPIQLITKRFRFTEIIEAFAFAASAGTIKVIIDHRA